MSDLLSPLLYVLRDESLAYTCFLSLIARCAPNFCIHSDSIALKIKLLGALLARYDPELWNYLVQVGADQMLFVYRWLLIECKREFPFEDSLRVLECMWSTLDYAQNRDDTVEINKKKCATSSYLTRSSSNASSISLRLIRQMCGTYGSNEDYLVSNEDEQDEDFVGSENMLALDENECMPTIRNKSRHQSQNSQISNNNNNNEVINRII